jgi:hypothetical protein
MPTERTILLVGDYITDRTWLVGEPSLLERYNSHYSVHPHTLVDPARETDVAGGIATVARAICSVVPSKATVIGAWSYYPENEFKGTRLVPMEGELKKSSSISFQRIHESEFTSIKTRVYLPEPGGARLGYRFDRNYTVADPKAATNPDVQWPDANAVDVIVLGDYGYGVLSLQSVQEKLKSYVGKPAPIILRSSNKELVKALDWNILMLNLHHLANFIDRKEPFDTPVTKQVNNECNYHPSVIAALGEVAKTLRSDEFQKTGAVLLNLESEGALILHGDSVHPLILASPHNASVTGVGANDVLVAHLAIGMMDAGAFGDRLRAGSERAVRASAAFVSSALQLEGIPGWYGPQVEVADDKIYSATPVLQREPTTLDNLQNAVKHAKDPLAEGKIKLRDAQWYLDGFHTVDAAFGEEIVRLKNRINDYVSEGAPHRPFFAVLCGEPGAGKSSLAQALGTYSGCEVIQANAAQWTSADDLFNLCELIRDAHMMGKKPLAFIDEVDSPSHNRDLFAKLLSPVWDGTYSSFGRTRHLGMPTVFILAGSGSLWRSGDALLGAGNPNTDNDHNAPKLEDLVSRLSTHPLDIRPLKERSGDIAYIVAHQILKRFPRVNGAAKGIFHLFKDCRYGARSIASVIEKFGPLKKERFLGVEDLSAANEDTLRMHLRRTPPEWKDLREIITILP